MAAVTAAVRSFMGQLVARSVFEQVAGRSGGHGRRGRSEVDRRSSRSSRTYSSGDLAVLVAVERQGGTVGDLPPQDWSLRITLVFRREGTEWRLVHRRADPLVRPVNPELSAAIARGEHYL